MNLIPMAVSSLFEGFVSEFVGTAILLVLGVGVVANNLLGKTKGQGTGFLFVNFGWGIGVMAGVYFASNSGGQLNPAVTVGLLIRELLLGNSIDWALFWVYILAEFLGAMLGAVLAWLAYKQHYDTDVDPALKLGTFATGPEIRNPFWNFLTEVIATFVLVGWVLVAVLQDPHGNAWAPIGVTLLIVGIGASLGGPTGYAINPVRDLGPRIVHAIVPIKGKGGSDWGYAWVPVVGPLVGGVLAALILVPIYTATGALPAESAPFFAIVAR